VSILWVLILRCGYEKEAVYELTVYAFSSWETAFRLGLDVSSGKILSWKGIREKAG
jgi:hypothetical protein